MASNVPYNFEPRQGGFPINHVWMLITRDGTMKPCAVDYSPKEGEIVVDCRFRVNKQDRKLELASPITDRVEDALEIATDKLRESVGREYGIAPGTFIEWMSQDEKNFGKLVRINQRRGTITIEQLVVDEQGQSDIRRMTCSDNSISYIARPEQSWPELILVLLKYEPDIVGYEFTRFFDLNNEKQCNQLREIALFRHGYSSTFLEEIFHALDDDAVWLDLASSNHKENQELGIRHVKTADNLFIALKQAVTKSRQTWKQGFTERAEELSTEAIVNLAIVCDYFPNFDPLWSELMDREVEELQLVTVLAQNRLFRSHLFSNILLTMVNSNATLLLKAATQAGKNGVWPEDPRFPTEFAVKLLRQMEADGASQQEKEEAFCALAQTYENERYSYLIDKQRRSNAIAYDVSLWQDGLAEILWDNHMINLPDPTAKRTAEIQRLFTTEVWIDLIPRIRNEMTLEEAGENHDSMKPFLALVCGIANSRTPDDLIETRWETYEDDNLHSLLIDMTRNPWNYLPDGYWEKLEAHAPKHIHVRPKPKPE